MYTISSEVVKIRKVELRMNEQVKYDVIKKLVETNGNKQHAAVTLGFACYAPLPFSALLLLRRLLKNSGTEKLTLRRYMLYASYKALICYLFSYPVGVSGRRHTPPERS